MKQNLNLTNLSSNKPKLAVPAELQLLNHPFYQAWMKGELSLKTLQDYSQQYYHHVKAFPAYLTSALQHPQSDSTREILAENLSEENGQKFGTPHPELWLQFAEGLGLDAASVEKTELRAGIRNVISTFSKLSENSLEDSLGCLFAYESQVPEVAASKIEGLQNQYGIQDKKTLAFFEIHKTADVEHRESLLKVIAQLTEVQKFRVQQAIDKSALALWDFLSEIYNSNGYTYARSV